MATPSDTIAARVECLKAALQLRTPGTSPNTALVIADVFFAWVMQGQDTRAGNRKPRSADPAE